jgi:hypothetical protein
MGRLILGPDVRKGIRRRGRLRGKAVELRGQTQHDVCIQEMNKEIQNLASGQRLKTYGN